MLPLLFSLLFCASVAHATSSKPPSFVYILADDQDAATANAEIMPLLHKAIASHGVNYTSFFTPMSVCCPSRVGFLRSQHGHSHNVTTVNAPYGGYDLFVSNGYGEDHLGTWLQDAGYNTMYVGKYMNGNTVGNAVTKPVRGWNVSKILLDPFTYLFYNASYSTNGGPPVQEPNIYSTDSIRDTGLSYLEMAAKDKHKPFFIGIAPIGPHDETVINMATNLPEFLPPVPAKRHAGLFNDSKVPRTASFNPDSPSSVSWIRGLAQLNATQVDYIDEWYRLRLRSLQAVDELVDQVAKKLEKLGLMDNTYLIYSSDNGFTTGQHRRAPGKGTCLEEDIRVPLLIRGPGIKKNSKNALSSYSNIDLSATIAELAGATPSYDVDGRIMDFGDCKAAPLNKKYTGVSTHHVSEYWVNNFDEGTVTPNDITNQSVTNKQRSLRIIEEGHNFAYNVWCTGERELYDMAKDSIQMNNLLHATNATPFANISSSTNNLRVANRMDALLLFLKSCKGSFCRQSWANLFPYGEVKSLDQALDPKYDSYFDALPRVHYDNCAEGFHLETEFPLWTTDLPYFKSENVDNTSSLHEMTKRQLGVWQNFPMA